MLLTPDGHWAVIAGGDNRVHVRDLEEDKEIGFLSGTIGPVNWVDVAPDGKTAITRRRRRIHLRLGSATECSAETLARFGEVDFHGKVFSGRQERYFVRPR